jgi:hypothetical protein
MANSIYAIPARSSDPVPAWIALRPGGSRIALRWESVESSSQFADRCIAIRGEFFNISDAAMH